MENGQKRASFLESSDDDVIIDYDELNKLADRGIVHLEIETVSKQKDEIKCASQCQKNDLKLGYSALNEQETLLSVQRNYKRIQEFENSLKKSTSLANQPVSCLQIKYYLHDINTIRWNYIDDPILRSVFVSFNAKLVSDDNKSYFWESSFNKFKDLALQLQCQMKTHKIKLEGTPISYITHLYSLGLLSIDMQYLASIPNGLKQTLYPHQNEGVIYAFSHRFCILLADEMGLGKTIQAVAMASVFGFPAKPVLVVCPPTLISQWSLAFSKWIISPSEINNVSECCSIPLKPLTIISYTVITKNPDIVPKNYFRMIILDESHRLTGIKTKLYSSLSPIIKKIEARVFISGTPALNRPADLYTQISLIRPDIFNNFREFAFRYCGGKIDERGNLYSKGSSNESELGLLLSSFLMIRRTKNDVARSLPEKSRYHVCLAFNPSNRLKSLQNSISMQRFSDEYVIDKIPPQQKAAVFDAYTLTSAEKLECVIRWLCSSDFQKTFIKDNRKCLIFAHHQSMLQGLYQWFNQMGVEGIMISGDTPMSNRDNLFNKFRNNSECRVAILSLESVGVGVNLVEASIVVFAELVFVPAKHLQAEDRVHRIGQKRSVDIYYLHARGSFDDRIWDILQKKLMVLGSVINMDDISFTTQT